MGNDSVDGKRIRNVGRDCKLLGWTFRAVDMAGLAVLECARHRSARPSQCLWISREGTIFHRYEPCGRHTSFHAGSMVQLLRILGGHASAIVQTKREGNAGQGETRDLIFPAWAIQGRKDCCNFEPSKIVSL